MFAMGLTALLMSQASKKTLCDGDIDEEADEGLSLNFFYTSVVASSLSNLVGVVAGHPLDTIRVRMQMDS